MGSSGRTSGNGETTRIESRRTRAQYNAVAGRSSSKPSSTDKGNFTNPPKPKSLRGKSGKKQGGQEGHCGETLHQSETPDRIIDHRIDKDTSCPTCGEAFGECAAGSDPLVREDCENRQVFDLPPIRLEVTEHRAGNRCCSGCGTVTTASFPEGVSAPVQYGPQVQTVASYLGGYQLLPYQRLSEAFSELFNCLLSAGTLPNFVKRGGAKAEEAMELRESYEPPPGTAPQVIAEDILQPIRTRYSEIVLEGLAIKGVLRSS